MERKNSVGADLDGQREPERQPLRSKRSADADLIAGVDDRQRAYQATLSAKKQSGRGVASEEIAKMMRGETFDPLAIEAVDQQQKKALGDIFEIGNNLPPGTVLELLNGREFHKDLMCPEPKNTWQPG